MKNQTDRPLRTSRLGERMATAEPVITQMMREALSRPGLLSLAAGFTDNALLPVAQVEAAVSRLAETVPSNEFLQYGTNQGRPGLRSEIARLLAGYPGEADLALSPEQVLVCNGSQQALYMSAQLFCDPGDIVLVESPTYFVFLELLKGMGLRPRSLPMTAEGRLDLSRLAQRFDVWNRAGELKRVKLLYFMGTYANPSARSWAEADKRALGHFLQQAQVSLPVIEDMAYRDLWFDQPASARSVLSLPEWEGLPALYSGTFTKPFATGLKVGYVASHCREWIERLARIKGHQDFGSSHFNQAILEDVLRQGAFQEYLENVRPLYRRKMEILDAALRAEGLEALGWRWQKPEGGLLLWALAPEHYDTAQGSPFYQACLEEGVFYVPGNLCFAEGIPSNAVRLSFGVLDEAGLKEAARRFVGAARRTPVSGDVKAKALAGDF